MWEPGVYGWEISIHALREEGDVFRFLIHLGTVVFLSTPSARRATIVPIHPKIRPLIISIHALREEGDPARPDC